MLGPDAATVKPDPRFRTPPWDRSSPEWLRIDATLPADHPARVLRTALDQLDPTELTAASTRTGSLPYPPDLMLAIALFEVHDGRNSPAQWARDLHDRDSLKWLGFGIQPSRSRCYAFRDRMAGRLNALLRQILRLAQTQGLTSAAHAALDGTTVAAVASRHKLLNAATLQKRLEHLDAACVADAVASDAVAVVTTATLAVTTTTAVATTAFTAAVATTAFAAAVATTAFDATVITTAVATAAVITTTTAAADAVAPGTTTAAVAASDAAPTRRPAWMAGTPRGRHRQRRRYAAARQVLETRLAANARRPPSERRDPAKIVVSPSEPGTVLGLDKTKVFRPLYNAQLAYDLDSEFVLGCGVFALATDIGTLGPMLEGIRAVTGRVPAVLLADAKYANLMDVKSCEQAGVTLYASVAKDVPPASTKAKAKAIPKSAFSWDADRREYRCPEGHWMPYASSVKEERAGGEVVYDSYRCPGELCRECPRRAACTPSVKGRMVSRAQEEEMLERLRERMATAAGKAWYQRRRETVERGFADLKRHRGLDRFHGRGVERAATELSLLVLAHNLLVLVRQQRALEETRVA